jgi:hypothetical protein
MQRKIKCFTYSEKNIILYDIKALSYEIIRWGRREN